MGKIKSLNIWFDYQSNLACGRMLSFQLWALERVVGTEVYGTANLYVHVHAIECDTRDNRFFAKQNEILNQSN